MAEYGEWNRKGATLSDVTAKEEYGVSRDFIVKGIQTAKLEYRDGAMWGNPYLRILRSQLEEYMIEEPVRAPASPLPPLNLSFDWQRDRTQDDRLPSTV